MGSFSRGLLVYGAIWLYWGYIGVPFLGIRPEGYDPGPCKKKYVFHPQGLLNSLEAIRMILRIVRMIVRVMIYNNNMDHKQ